MTKNTAFRIAGVVLAAGDSRRMGHPKALLEIRGKTFLQTIVRNLERAHINPIMVIAGNAYDTIAASMVAYKHVAVIKNSHPEDGQLSSLKIAIRNLPQECPGLIQVLVDHPLVNLTTYKKLHETAGENPDSLIIPAYKDKRGHPVYFGKPFFRDLLNAPLSAGAKHVVSQQGDKIHLLHLNDPGITIDIDTPEEYRRYK